MVSRFARALAQTYLPSTVSRARQLTGTVSQLLIEIIFRPFGGHSLPADISKCL